MANFTEVELGKTKIQFIDGDRSSRYPKRDEFVEEGIMFLNAESINSGSINKAVANYISEEKFSEIKKGRIKRGDLLLTTRGNGVGNVAYVNTNELGLINAQMLILRTNEQEISSKFLFYYFSSTTLYSYIQNFASGSAQPQIPIRDLKKIPVFLPSLKIQEKIAVILSTYDDLIENNKKRIQILENMAEELYKEWFVRFRFPNWENTEFEKGIPKDWNTLKMSEIVSYYIGGGWGEEEQNLEFSEEAYVIRGTDIPKFNEMKFSEKVLRFHKPSNLKSRLLQAYDLIFEVSGGSKDQLLGRNLMITPNLLNIFENKVICASFCKLIRFDLNKVNPFFMKYFMKLYYKYDLVGLYQVQSTGISNYQFESFLKHQTIQVPTKPLTDQFEKIVKPLVEQMENLGLQNELLVSTRDNLLPRLISGKLSVENLDIQFPPSMQEQ